MPITPPPPPPSQEEWDRRKKKCKEEGKPMTIENMDPDFAEWKNRQRLGRHIGFALTGVGGLFFALTFIALIV
jgi:hypothetical protein